MSTLVVLLTIIASVLTLCGLIAAALSWRWAAAFSYLAFWALYYVPEFILSDGLMTFWGIATLIALGINYMLPFQVATSRLGMGYIVGGALCGTLLGLVVVSQAATICGIALGCLLGGIAYSRTPRGRIMNFPSHRFFNYILAKGLPLTVVMSISGITMMAIYQFYSKF